MTINPCTSLVCIICSKTVTLIILDLQSCLQANFTDILMSLFIKYYYEYQKNIDNKKKTLGAKFYYSKWVCGVTGFNPLHLHHSWPHRNDLWVQSQPIVEPKQRKVCAFILPNKMNLMFKKMHEYIYFKTVKL